MRCQALVITRKNPTKKDPNRTSYKFVGDLYPRYRPVPGDHSKLIEYYIPLDKKYADKDVHVCNGKIKILVGCYVENDYYDEDYSNPHSHIEINAICEQCGYNFHGPRIPTNMDDVSTILTKYIESLDP